MPELREYQRAALERMLSEPGRSAWLLADEPGLGKTATALSWARARDVASLLVVCPASLRLNWRREASAWWGGWEPALGWEVLSYEGLTKAIGSMPPFEAVVFDEAHYLKNPSAARTRAAFRVPADSALFLTGTPVVNRPMDLWPMLHGLGLAGSRIDFGTRYCNGRRRAVPVKGGGVRLVWDFSGASNLDALAALLAPLMIRRTKAEVLTELPPKIRQIVELPPAPGGRTRASAALLARVGDWERWSDVQAFAQMPPALLQELSRIRLEDGLRKLPAAVAYIRDVILEEDDKTVVFAWHREVLEALARELPGAVLLYGGMSDREKDAAVRAFQEGEARVFVGQIQAAGTGLTLTAARTVVFVEMDWVPGNMTQAEDRCHRLGQRDAVRVLHLVEEDSIDARVTRALVRKRDMLDALENERVNAALAAPSGRGTAQPHI
jgi:SWI/SNF-related matrix-associated actin-dependent regulator 1 of chromatin subfamily A